MTSKSLAVPDEKSFAEVVEMIQAARGRAQLYETYRDDEKVGPLVRQLYWSLVSALLTQLGWSSFAQQRKAAELVVT